jgi:hypothetical protein
VLEMLDFNGEKNVINLSFPLIKSIVFEVNLSTYKNKESLKGYLKYICTEYEEGEKGKPYLFHQALEKLALDGSVSNSLELESLSIDRNDFGILFCELKKLNGKHYYIHRLVADAFIPKEENKKLVHHTDSNKKNNNLSNLRRVNHQENTLFYYQHKKESETAEIETK